MVKSKIGKRKEIKTKQSKYKIWMNKKFVSSRKFKLIWITSWKTEFSGDQHDTISIFVYIAHNRIAIYSEHILSYTQKAIVYWRDWHHIAFLNWMLSENI